MLAAIPNFIQVLAGLFIGRRSGPVVYAEGSPRPQNVICTEKFDPLRLSKIARVLTEIR
jgi:hypothetical protein